MSDQSFDVIVIGGGPGGYIAAIRAAQLGMSVACVEKRGSLGGTCLNIGCIPSKALLHSSYLYEHTKAGLAAQGIKVGNVDLDLPTMLVRKDKVVTDLTKGVEFLFKKNKIAWLKGLGRLAGPGKIEVKSDDGKTDTYGAKNVIIATGSESTRLPGLEIDEKRIVTSTGALSLPKVPEHLVVIGAGFIGLEMGSVWRRLGSRVTVVEFLDRILPTMDGEVGREMQKILTRQGLAFRLGTKVTGAKTSANGVELTLEPAKGGTAEKLSADVVLVSVGRVPNTEGLGGKEAGLKLDSRGRIEVDDSFRTGVPGIYAIGDVIHGPMLAHKAMDEGEIVAEIIAGQSGHMNYDTVPGIVYTHPEAASVGKTEEELKAQGVVYKVGKFPMSVNSRSRCTGDTDGFVKILADAKTDRVLGVHIIGAQAGTMIAELVLAMEFGASAEDIARTCHGHPTESEAVKEAALAVEGRTLHL
ncbi:MAG TPA: dihydrolipoyl dehydrogenase [Alphaproteobacteria bacterium]|nr:dihydrolipoyl dehydrogenase [Alphaproteobacteria bacterium]